MRNQLYRIIASAVLFTLALFITEKHFQLGVFIISYLIIGSDILFKAVKNIIKGQVFDEHFLMAIATLGAFAIGEYPEGVAVMLFYQIGELFQDFALDRSRKSIAELMNIRPDYANVKRGNDIVVMDPNKVSIGDTIVIKAGERVPLDCEVIEGSSLIDTSALTGESVPSEISAGSELLSGSININGLITARVTKEFGESTVSRILDLVENASNKKSKSERFITRFARVYTPIVVIVAVILAVVPPILISGATFNDWIYRALIFLVVSCPCALVISIPLSFFGGIGGASKKGILVKGGNYLEALANAEVIVFDKTGTLTKGVFKVQEISPVNMSEEELLKYAAYAENFSNHPISISIKDAYGEELDSELISEVEEIPGEGVSAKVSGKIVLAGNSKMMKRYSIDYNENPPVGTIVHLAINGTYEGYILISDELKPDSGKAIRELRKLGIKQLMMLTGDAEQIALKVADELGIDDTYAELLPTQKVEILESLFDKLSSKGKLVFIGDGINDAPVIVRSDVGIAMGALGSDAAIEAADIVIMKDEPSKVATAIR
ncbi:MAG: cadmium-translocating P-type ATPase, partial [Clostridiales bacterium]|nr:cadmium-translocating P-type ATPase [Clostridiales bacterium]